MIQANSEEQAQQIEEQRQQYVLEQSSPSKGGHEGMEVNKERDFQEEKVKHIKEQTMKCTKEHKDQKKSLMKHNV